MVQKKSLPKILLGQDPESAQDPVGSAPFWSDPVKNRPHPQHCLDNNGYIQETISIINSTVDYLLFILFVLLFLQYASKCHNMPSGAARALPSRRKQQRLTTDMLQYLTGTLTIRPCGHNVPESDLKSRGFCFYGTVYSV
jgi:hypothetical protein